MPTIFIHKGYRFFFYSGDRLEPIHVHIEKEEAVAKFWVKPLELAANKGFRSHELKEIRLIIEESQEKILEKWNEHFSKKV